MLDIRTLKPLDEDALLASAAKTGRVVIVQEAPRTAGYGAELAAILAEKAILDLHGPVLRVTGYDVPVPVLADRGRVHAVGRAGRRRGPRAARVLSGWRAASALARARPVGLLPPRCGQPASPCAGTTRASASCRSRACRIAPRRCPTRRSTPGAGSRSCPSPTTSTTRNAVGDLERGADAAGSATCRARPPRSSGGRAGRLALASRGRFARADRPARRLGEAGPDRFRRRGLRVQASGSRGGTDRGRGRALARRGGPGDRRGRPARRDPDGQDDGRDPFAGGGQGRAHPRRRRATSSPSGPCSS